MNTSDAKMYRFGKWLCASVACIPIALLVGGSQPYIPNGTLTLNLYYTYFGLVFLFCLYGFFCYRQKDPSYKFGWKLARSKGPSHVFLVVLFIFPMAALMGYLLLFPTEIALAYIARVWKAPMQTVPGVCVSAYRYKLRGPGNEIKLPDGKTVRLFGYPMICEKQLRGNIVLTVRASPIGMWVTRIDPAS